MIKLDIKEFEAIVFDLDSTLLDTHHYPLVASRWLLEKSNVVSEEKSAAFLKNLVMRYFRGIQDIVDGAPFRTPFEIVRTAMSNSLRDIDHEVNPSLVEEATQRFKALHIELSEPYPGVVEMLDALKSQGIKMGVLSNSFEGHAVLLLKKLKLHFYFQAVVDCGTVKAFKPMSSIFQRILDDLGVNASNTLFVGDEYYADMVGAKQVRLKTVWINSRNYSMVDMIAKYGPSSAPDYVTSSIAEFAELL
ncbi:MAG: HAD family hydrolase [Candidatus Thorarchaeota archaeon]|nr:HAD family hydrolase [Candidatus Thorarchaeota archaeon]